MDYKHRKDIVMNNGRTHKPIYIDGQPFIVRLLTSEEWDNLIDTVGADNKLLHYSKTASWVQDKRDDWSSRRIVRGGQQAHSKNSYSESDRGPRVGYRPCLEPLNPLTYKPDISNFSNVRDGEVLTFGSLRLDDRSFSVPKSQASEGDIMNYSSSFSISIGNSTNDFSDHIQWVKAGNLLVADRNILKGVSWAQLNLYGLVYGQSGHEVARDRALGPKPEVSDKFSSVDSLIARATAISEQSKKLAENLEKFRDGFEME